MNANMSASKEDNRAADKAARASFIINTFLLNTCKKPHSSQEQAILTQAEQNLSTSKDEEEIIDDSLFFSKSVVIKNGIGIGTCTGVVQTSPEELTAFTYLTDTHHDREAHIAANGPDSSKYPNKTICVINDHHHITYSCRKLPPPLKPREWLARGIFRQVDEDNFILVYTPVADDDPDLPPSFTKTTLKNAIRGEFTAMHKYERLPHNQTRFTLRLKLDIKGRVPKKIANMGISGALDSVYKAYKYFQRDEEIDVLEVSLAVDIVNKNSPANPLTAPFH